MLAASTATTATWMHIMAVPDGKEQVAPPLLRQLALPRERPLETGLTLTAAISRTTVRCSPSP
eukprot:CAMPEP_0182560720 /NCGR_PEP_ID=MMETSP1324-20130603/3309_1 /TAXON_ID=236786 /ORGANISM="Florenciella sp., Strain RCC1587" /LENGTH=62 /DNA_ID=CAMNT_0024773107 /DNA_START=384 /DNA_END=570 /DNA_ORIENTATION=+